MSKKQKIRTPEEKKTLIAKVTELRKTLQSNGRTMNAHDACKAVGVPYATWYSWLAANKKQKVTRRKKPTSTNLMTTLQTLTAPHMPKGQEQSQTKKRRPVMFFAGDADDIKDVLNSMGMGSFQQ